MFRPYRTLKIKVPRPCCPWCQTHSERIEQQLQAVEKQILELSARLATTTPPSQKAENLLEGFQTALQLLGQGFGQGFGLNSIPCPTGEGPRIQTVHLVGAFSAMIAALDRLAEAPEPPSPKSLSPQQPTQLAAPQNRPEQPAS